MKILVAIANWGTNNDQYLARVVQEYRSMPFDVDIVVHSNIPKTVAPEVELLVVDLNGKDPRSLPYFHKTTFADRRDDYDLFIYSEDDTLITERNIRAFLSACEVVSANEVPGFIRFERGPDGQVYYPEIHGPNHWNCHPVRCRGDHVFATFSNEHSACYVLTRQQLHEAIGTGGYLVRPHRGKYDMICSAGTDPYTQCGFQRVIDVTSLDDFLVHHLSNRYAGTSVGVNAAELCRQRKALLEIGRNGGHSVAFFPAKSNLMDLRFSLDCFDRVQQHVISAIPKEVRSVLSVGCGCGTTEAMLAERGLRVVAVPVDPVIASGAKEKGVKIVDSDFVTARKSLDKEKFDCLLLLDTLHLIRDPIQALSLFAPLLRPGSIAIVQVPRVLRLTTLFRIIRGDQSFKELGNYDTTGVHFTSRRVIRRWLENSGLKVERTTVLMPPSASKKPRLFQRVITPILATMMGAKMFVVARKN